MKNSRIKNHFDGTERRNALATPPPLIHEKSGEKSGQENAMLATCVLFSQSSGADTGGGGYGGSSPPLPESGRVYSVRTRSVT